MYKKNPEPYAFVWNWQTSGHPSFHYHRGDLNSKHQYLFSQHPNFDSSIHNPNYLTNLRHYKDLQYRLESYPTELSSDYTPVTLNLLCHTSESLPPKPLYFTDWAFFESLMNEALHKIYNDSSISYVHSEIWNLTTLIIKKCTRVNPLTNVDKSLPRRIFIEINFIRYFHSQWQRYID